MIKQPAAGPAYAVPEVPDEAVGEVRTRREVALADDARRGVDLRRHKGATLISFSA